MASSVFGAILSSFIVFAVLFVRMAEGALYDSDVIAANGLGGG